MPTSAGAAAALGAGTTAVQQPAAGTAPPPLVRARAAAAAAELARKERGAEERSEVAAEAALRVLKPPAKRKAAEAGCRSILSMPGFSKSVVSGGVTYVVQPPALNFGRLKCSHPRCSFTSDHQKGLTSHMKHCPFARQPALGTAQPAGESSEEDSDDRDDDSSGGADEEPPVKRRRGEPKQDGRINNRGSARRKRYTFAEKAEALDQLAGALERGETHDAVEERLGLASGQLSAWKKKAAEIYLKASDALTASLKRNALRKCAATARYPAMELRLVGQIQRYRARGRHLSVRWLVTKARVLFAEMYPDEEDVFMASRSWRRRFCKRHGLTRLKPTNVKLKSVAERLPIAKEWHQKFALLVSMLPPGVTEAEMHAVFGRFLPELRCSMDQVAVPFTSAADKTFEFVGESRVQTKAQAEGLLKRQATIILHFFGQTGLDRYYGQLGLIFKGQGRLPAAEKAAYDPRVCVFFQPKAWMDRPIALEWVRRVWAPLVAKKPAGEKLMLLDNLDAHVDMPFRAALRELQTLAWYLPPGCTDFLQPVDAGAGRLIVTLYLEAQDIWLDIDENLELWEAGKLTAAQRRILMTRWLGAAWEKFNSRQYDGARHRWFQKTGGLMTADGSADDKITPEGTTKYSFERLDVAAATAAAAAAAEDANAAAAAAAAAVVATAVDSDSDIEDSDVELDDILMQPLLSDPTMLEAAVLAQAEAPDDDELELMTFAEMVKLASGPGEQFNVLSGPPTLDRSLVGKSVAVRIVDVGWCAGTVVRTSSSARVKSFNYDVRFDADDVMELWLKPERYVGVATANATNSWGGLDKAIASSWTLYGLSILPRAGTGRFELTEAARAAVAARALPCLPSPPPRGAADALPRSTAVPRAAELPAPLQALRSGAARAPEAAAPAAPGSFAKAEPQDSGAAGVASQAAATALISVVREVVGLGDECEVKDVLRRLNASGIELRPGQLDSLGDWLRVEHHIFLQNDMFYMI